MAIELEGLEWARGDDVTLPFTIIDANGDPVDITSWTALACYIKVDLEAPGNPLVTRSIANGGIVKNGGTGGTGTITIPRASTLTLTGSHTFWLDFWREDTGASCQLARGEVLVRGQNRTAP